MNQVPFEVLIRGDNVQIFLMEFGKESWSIDVPLSVWKAYNFGEFFAALRNILMKEAR